MQVTIGKKQAILTVIRIADFITKEVESVKKDNDDKMNVRYQSFVRFNISFDAAAILVIMKCLRFFISF